MTAPSLMLAALADDFTGAVELAAMLRAAGARTRLVVGRDAIPQSAGEAEALVVALRSRVAPAAEAEAEADAAATSLKRLGARMLFLKYCASFDSLESGNIGNVAEVLRRHGPPAPVLFCPSFPEAARCVFRAHLFIQDQLLEHSPKRHDPLTPMTRSDLRQVLAPQTGLGVGWLPYEAVLQGDAAIRHHADAEQQAGRPFLIADAITEEDLQRIAWAARDWPLLTGGSSVAAWLPRAWQAEGRMAVTPPGALAPLAGPGAVLAGSCAERTRQQVAEFGRRHPVLAIDPLDEPEAAFEQALSWASQRLGTAPFCLTTSADPARVAAAQAALGPIPAGRRAEALLARLGAALAQRGLRRLLVAGGETSGAVVEGLGIRELEVAPYREIGMGLCRADAPVPLLLCLKSGKLGAVDMFERTLAEMEGQGMRVAR
ncbi:3-oxo-tetronate kinase [Pseudoroseomonas cervicalis]|uniref:3-oxo-tetronate kinase n=1 Tax=Teichococcus cervicalis TaxID=204525 RepID=UPI0022F15F67|nr:3-oxo-tetronate kinase [Pseudoroseomonas cervicalis]WBV45190.1 hypothetical protein PFY06_19300 [Pseudoroseomonas cervicalis]